MKPLKIVRLAASAALIGACCAGLAACSSLSGVASVSGTAATVGDTEIKEAEVASYIETFREGQGLTDDETWSVWMSTYGMDPETVREEVIDHYIDIEVIKQAADSLGVSVSDEEVDEQVDSMKSNYSTDEEWQEALESAGYTEQDYRDSVESSMLSAKVQEAAEEQGLIEEEEVTDDEVLTYVAMYASSFDGAKRSSHILFSADDEETAQEVLDQINSGSLSFEDAAKEYSIDETSAENGGDVGWDMLNSFVTEYTTALDGLEEGQVSALVTSDYGIHIIKCTEVYSAPEEGVTSLDQAPEALVDYVREMLDSDASTNAFDTWLESFKEGLDIQINDMPEGLPYDVEMTSEDSSDGEDEAATEEADAESAAESDEASDESAEGEESEASTDGQAEAEASTDGQN